MFALKEWEKKVAWLNARPVPGWPDLRIDCDQRLIRWPEYGQTSTFGWEVDHLSPIGL